MTRDSLPGPRSIAATWVMILLSMMVLAWKGYLQAPHYWGLLLVAMQAFLTGARVERFRSELVARIQPPAITERTQALREAREVIKKHAISTWRAGLTERSDAVTEVLVDFDLEFPEGPMVRLSEQDYVHARDGNQAELYQPAIADATQAPASEVWQLVTELAQERNLQFANQDTLLQLTREVMFERYEAELARTAS